MLHRVLKLIGRKYDLGQKFNNSGFIINRHNNKVKMLISNVFNTKISTSYSEIFFFRFLFLSLFGNKESNIGKKDAKISGKGFFKSLLARQVSFSCNKK